MPEPPWSGKHCFVTSVQRCSLLTPRLRCWWCWVWDWDLNWSQVLREWSAQLTLGADCYSTTNCEQINSNIIDGKLASGTWNQQYWFIKEKNSGINLAMLNFLVEFKVKSLLHKSTCTNCTRRRMGGFTSGGGHTLILCTFVHNNKHQAGTHRCKTVSISANGTHYTLMHIGSPRYKSCSIMAHIGSHLFRLVNWFTI